MKTKFLIGILIGSALLLAQTAVIGTAALVATTTSAPGEPIDGVDVKLQKNPGGIIVQTQSDAKGTFSLGTLSAGNYKLEFDGKSLGKAISKIDPESKGPNHVIEVLVIDLADQKRLVSSEQPVRRGLAGQDVRVTFTIPDDPAAGKQKHSYKGTITLVR